MGWILALWLILIAVLYFIHAVYGESDGDVRKWANGVAGAVLVVGVIATFKLTNTASFERSLKSIDSEFNQSIYREIKVHSRSGEVIYESAGQFDVEYANDRLKWVDEDGRVQIIYLGDSATAVVNEVEELE